MYLLAIDVKIEKLEREANVSGFFQSNTKEKPVQDKKEETTL